MRKEENEVYVLMKQYGYSTDIIAVSDSKEKLIKKMKEVAGEILTIIYGEKEKLDPVDDEYAIDIWDSIDVLNEPYWSDGNDECPTELYITTAEKV